MTDPINTYSRSAGGANAVSGNRPAARKEAVATGSTESTPKAATVPTTAAGTRAVQDETLELSETARRSMSDPSFDQAKVEAIKTALREGNYPLDSRKIAESFVALERLIDD